MVDGCLRVFGVVVDDGDALFFGEKLDGGGSEDLFAANGLGKSGDYSFDIVQVVSLYDSFEDGEGVVVVAEEY